MDNTNQTTDTAASSKAAATQGDLRYLPIRRAESPAQSVSSSIPRATSLARLASPLPGTPPTGRILSVRRDSPPVDAAQPNLAPLDTSVRSTSAGPGISALAEAFSGPQPASGSRQGTPPLRPSSTLNSSNDIHSLNLNAPGNGSGTVTPREDPEIVKRHLVRPYDTGANSETSSGHATKGKQSEGSDADEEFSSLQLQGGDVTRPIYKWAEEANGGGPGALKRRNSFELPRPEPASAALDINAIKVPGGFRRNFLWRSNDGPSVDGESGSTNYGSISHPGTGHPSGGGHESVVTSSFLEFLTIYGHFAGEELQEDDEDLGPGEYFVDSPDRDFYGDESEGEAMEDSALLTPGARKRRRRDRGNTGTNSPTGAVMLLLKSFVGTGVLFLPRAFLNGGLTFSTLVLFAVAILSYHCFVLLVSSRLKVEGSFGDIGGILYGKWMRAIILFSVVISQLGFVAAYIVFTAENLQAFLLAVTDCKLFVPIYQLIISQMAIFLPFSLLRDISKLGFTALIADAFILIGLGYLFYFDLLTLNTSGLADVVQFNPRDWTLFIGTAIFTFEGIGLIIPIQESMKDPRQFPRVMGLVMVVITTLFITIGAVSYAAYGSKTEMVVLLNLPQDSGFVNMVQFLYSLAILLSTPLQIFPAIRITENALFTRSGKYNPMIKWQKNVFRFFVVVLCGLVAYGGADNLDKFVALIGNFACIPLVYIYPPLLHYRAVARTRAWKTWDLVLCAFGIVAMVYTTSLTVMSWAQASPPREPRHCAVRP